jgi:hypothetical protein
MESNTFYSYSDFIRNRKNFKIVNDADIFDTPAALFYKIIFYFNDEQGFLGVDRINDEKITLDSNYKNTALNFLRLNNELDRAFLLKKFLYLLSSINTETPWYFQEISGLDNAIERKIFSDKEVKIEDTPRQLTIKCLNDAVDNRIGTLLDLYRAICYSYDKRKEIIPANLRKFNMGILLFNAPLRGITGKSAGKNININIANKNNIYKVKSESEEYDSIDITSAKLYEFKNCEIDYNSSKSAFSSLNTTDGPMSPEYTITINYNDCYESRFNDVMKSVITDFINVDENFENSLNKNLQKVVTPSGKYEQLSNDLETRFDFENADEQYWLKTDLNDADDNDLINNKLKVSNAAKNIYDTYGNATIPTLFVSQVNRVATDIKQAIQIPKIKIFNENIHNNGTVTRFGRYEYLNRVADGGLLGKAVNNLVGAGISSVEDTLGDTLKKIYLGNIRTMPINSDKKEKPNGNIRGEAEPRKDYKSTDNYKNAEIRNLNNGDLGDMYTKREQRNLSKGVQGDIFENLEPRNLNNYPIGTIPGYVQKTQYLNKLNESKSIRNNL